MNAPDNSIPKDLLNRAEAVAVFPGMLKAGFVVGGRGGSGLISRRVTGGWSAPAYFNMGGASVGLQIGAAKTDLVLLFMNDDALRGLLGDKLEIAVAASLLTTSASLAQQAERQRTATQPTSTATPKQQKEASKKASAAARVFDQIMNAPDNSIPKDLLDESQARRGHPLLLAQQGTLRRAGTEGCGHQPRQQPERGALRPQGQRHPDRLEQGQDVGRSARRHRLPEHLSAVLG
jgi:lipid-binding SYLF domain-containing protein